MRDEINQKNAGTFEAARPSEAKSPRGFYSTRFKEPNAGGKTYPEWRGWESPRTGHYFDLEGVDANGVGMAPAPALGSEELAAEMAEVYAMALLRDIPFNRIEDGTGVDPNTVLSVQDVVDALNDVEYFSKPFNPASFAGRRLAARFRDPAPGDTPGPIDRPAFSPTNLFKGSSPGTKVGRYVSQFMLLGNNAGDAKETCVAAGPSASADPRDGYIAYGNQFIDQRQRTFLSRLDYMIDWN